jgi:hypothetical protein
MIEHSLKVEPFDPPPVVACPDGLYRLQGTDWVLIDWVENPRRASFARELLDGNWEAQVIYYEFDANLDANAEFEKSSHGKKMGDWVRFASVPEPLARSLHLDEMLKQGDNKALSRVFNDPDNRKFRTHRGRF